MILLLFPDPGQTSQSPIPSTLFTQIQTMSYYVASTGLVLQEESTHIRPPWQIWAHVEAKRRSMCSLYLLHWAYSVYHGEVNFDCRELSRMPGPGAKFLWHATDENNWNSLYTRWLAQWDGQDFCKQIPRFSLTSFPVRLKARFCLLGSKRLSRSVLGLFWMLDDQPWRSIY